MRTAMIAERSVAIASRTSEPAWEAFLLNAELDGVQINAYLSAVAMARYPAILRQIPSLLSPTELKAWQGLGSSYRQAGFLLGLYAAKKAAAAYLGETALANIEIVRGISDFCFLRHSSPNRPEISLSNASDCGVALAYPQGCSMGIDIDSADQDRVRYYRQQMRASELALAERESPKGGEAVALAVLSTAKEALARTLRLGPADLWHAGAIASLAVLRDSTTVCYFTYFPQYQCRSWVLGGKVLSIVLPRQSSLHFDPTGFMNFAFP